MSLDKAIKELENYKPTEKDLNPDVAYKNVKSVSVSARQNVSAVHIHPAKSFICPNCGAIGNPKSFTKGSMLIEIVLWMMILLPGLVYSLWRLTTRTKVCSTCGAENIIPLHSPVGRKLYDSLHK